MDIGIIGVPFSGKTTIFESITRGAQSGRGTNIGTARVPDQRLTKLAEIFRPKSVVEAEISFVDIPSEHSTESMFTGKALGVLQKMDALLLIVRAFKNESVPHTEGSVDFIRDLERVQFDLSFADITLVDKRIERMKSGLKPLKAPERAEVMKRIDILKSIQDNLEKGEALRGQELSSEAIRAISDTFLLSRLPLIAVANIGEDSLERTEEVERRLAEVLIGGSTAGAAICGQMEKELADIEADEEAEMRRELGLSNETGLDKVIATTYEALGLISFITTGEDEVRAWTITKGDTAPKAAGKVHSDIERGFIRAEVISYDDFIQAGNMAEARKQGTLRREGRDYIIQDGDIVNFLFSV